MSSARLLKGKRHAYGDENDPHHKQVPAARCGVPHEIERGQAFSPRHACNVQTGRSQQDRHPGEPPPRRERTGHLP